MEGSNIDASTLQREVHFNQQFSDVWRVLLSSFHLLQKRWQNKWYIPILFKIGSNSVWKGATSMLPRCSETTILKNYFQLYEPFCSSRSSCLTNITKRIIHLVFLKINSNSTWKGETSVSARCRKWTAILEIHDYSHCFLSKDNFVINCEAGDF